jgi:hypothetical protein
MSRKRVRQEDEIPIIEYSLPILIDTIKTHPIIDSDWSDYVDAAIRKTVQTKNDVLKIVQCVCVRYQSNHSASVMEILQRTFLKCMHVMGEQRDTMLQICDRHNIKDVLDVVNMMPMSWRDAWNDALVYINTQKHLVHTRTTLRQLCANIGAKFDANHIHSAIYFLRHHHEMSAEDWKYGYDCTFRIHNHANPSGNTLDCDPTQCALRDPSDFGTHWNTFLVQHMQRILLDSPHKQYRGWLSNMWIRSKENAQALFFYHGVIMFDIPFLEKITHFLPYDDNSYEYDTYFMRVLHNSDRHPGFTGSIRYMAQYVYHYRLPRWNNLNAMSSLFSSWYAITNSNPPLPLDRTVFDKVLVIEDCQHRYNNRSINVLANLSSTSESISSAFTSLIHSNMSTLHESVASNIIHMMSNVDVRFDLSLWRRLFSNTRLPRMHWLYRLLYEDWNEIERMLDDYFPIELTCVAMEYI